MEDAAKTNRKIFRQAMRIQLLDETVAEMQAAEDDSSSVSSKSTAETFWRCLDLHGGK